MTPIEAMNRFDRQIDETNTSGRVALMLEVELVVSGTLIKEELIAFLPIPNPNVCKGDAFDITLHGYTAVDDEDAG